VKDSIDKIKCVNILYKGDKINNLSVSKVAIWNAGKDAIRNTDIANKDKLRIEIDEEYKILECELLHQINKANDFKLKRISDNIFEIDFDYFNYNEGIIVLVYHTAIIENSLNIKGSFVDAEKIIKDDSAKKIAAKVNKSFDSPLIDNILKKKIAIPVLIFIPILSIVYTIFTDITKIAITIVIIWNIIILGLYWLAAYFMMKIRMPKGFDMFYEDFNLFESKF
jgi:hypothetical protein